MQHAAALRSIPAAVPRHAADPLAFTGLTCCPSCLRAYNACAAVPCDAMTGDFAPDPLAAAPHDAEPHHGTVDFSLVPPSSSGDDLGEE